MTSNFYSRTLTLKEAREGYIIILKHRLSLFPPRGQLFTLKSTEQERIVKIESLKRQDEGTGLPYELHLLRWKGLSDGDHVVIEQNIETPSRYKLFVE